MSSLIVLAFPDESGAQNVLTLINDLQKQRLITVDDAATVVRGRHGKPKVQQATSLVGDGAWGGAFWGMLLGLLFFVPFLGLAIGAVTGALMGKFRDVGIDDRFIREVQEKVQPGQSALFLLVREVTLDRVLAELQPYHPEVLQTSLSEEQEAKLREALGGAPAEAVAAAEAVVEEPAAGATDGAAAAEPTAEAGDPAPAGAVAVAAADPVAPAAPAGAAMGVAAGAVAAGAAMAAAANKEEEPADAAPGAVAAGAAMAGAAGAAEPADAPAGAAMGEAATAVAAEAETPGTAPSLAPAAIATVAAGVGTMDSAADAGTTIGPIQLVVVGFPPDSQFRGEIIRELSQLRGRGVVRLLDALFVRKDDQGRISATMRESDVTLEQRQALGAVAGGLAGYLAGGEGVAVRAADETAQAIAGGAFGLGLGDLQTVKDQIGPGQAALLLLFEHTWAAALKGAVRGAGGVPLAQGFLTPEALVLVGAEARAVVEAEATIALADAVKGAAVLDALAVVAEAEEVKQAAAAEAARALIAAGLIEAAAAQEVVDTLVAADLIEEGAAAEAAAAVAQADAQDAGAAQVQSGEGTAAGAPVVGPPQAADQGTPTPAP